MTRLILYTRPFCTLCAELEYDLVEHFADRYQLERRNVDERPEWVAAHGLTIPVLTTAAGEVLCRTVLDPAAVDAYLRDATLPV